MIAVDARALRVWLLCVAGALFLAAPVAADEVDDMLDDFDDDVIIDEPEPSESSEPPPPPDDVDDWLKDFAWELNGDLAFQGSYSYRGQANKPGPGTPNYGESWSKLESKINVELDLDLAQNWRARIAGHGMFDAAYRVNGRSDYTRRTLREHEDEVELDEAWLQGSPIASMDIKFGRQIVNWGRSETIRIIDVLNPLDNREPGVTDIEFLRLPVTMTKVDYYYGDWSLTGIAVHEFRTNKDPEFGAEFYPFAVFIGEEKPGNGGADTEWAAQLQGIFSGWDVSFHYIRYFDDQAYLDIPRVVRRYNRQTLTGASTNYAWGNWLFKAEGAYINGQRLIRPAPKVNRYDILGGFEYSGFTDQTISIEFANRHIASFDHDLGLGPPFLGAFGGLGLPSGFQRNRFEQAFRYTGDFMNQRLSVTALAFLVGAWGEDGGTFRLSGEYELMDALNVGGGIVMYKGGDLPTFAGNKNNDRLFFTAKYSF